MRDRRKTSIIGLVVAAMLVAGSDADATDSKREIRSAMYQAVKHWPKHRRGRFYRLVKCESHLDPRARSDGGMFLGLTQQHRGYWPERAARAGFKGASIFNVKANLGTAVDMISNGGGWGHWEACS